jgi:hypothetical protein
VAVAGREAEAAGDGDETRHEIKLIMKRASSTQILTGALLAISSWLTGSAAEISRAFASPEEAAEALASAAQAKDSAALRVLFGPATDELRNPDRVQGENELSAFAAAYAANHRIVRASDKRAELEVGTNNWPFPVPLAQNAGEWFFDAEAGCEELTNRRIGRNELSALRTMRAYVEAQREYASQDRDGDEVLEFAQHVLSAAGRKDGLYWSPELGGELSPLGPLIAAAYGEGYRKSTGETSGPQPFHGYCFRILTRQGASAPGGQYDYMINGNLIGGFALVAWPAQYGNSGVMTFMVNQQGRVYQKDLGPKTAAIAKITNEYNPDKSWTLSPD